MPTTKTNQNSTDARQRTYAQLEAMGLRPGEIARHLGLGQTSSLESIRRGSYEKGYVQELQQERDEQVVDMRVEREKLAKQCFDVMIRKSTAIAGKKDGKITLGEAEACRRMVEVTEHTGRRMEVPAIEVNVRQETNIGIQTELNMVVGLLKKSGISLESIEHSSS